MTRDALFENLTAYIDGELSPAEAREVEVALKADPELQALETSLRRTVSTLASLTHPEASPSLRRQVLTAVDRPSFSERLRALFRPALWPAYGAMVAGAVALVIYLRPARGLNLEEDELYLAQNMEVLEDYELVGLDGADDLEVIASMNELEAQP